jgi:hypothetical protein
MTTVKFVLVGYRHLFGEFWQLVVNLDVIIKAGAKHCQQIINSSLFVCYLE